MKKIFLLLIITFLSSCHESKEKIKEEPFDLNTLPKDWVRLTENNNKLVVFNSCDSGNLLLKITKKDSGFEMLLHGEQEDSAFKVLEVNQLKDTIFIITKSLDLNEKQTFKFSWLNKKKRIRSMVYKIFKWTYFRL